MLYSPYWLQWSRVGGQSGDDVPVDVGNLVTEEFIVDLRGLVSLRDNPGNEVDFFDQLHSLWRCQVKEFRRVALENNHRPAGEKLIVVKKDLRESQVNDEVIGSRPGP
jgi:hypothetical protein